MIGFILTKRLFYEKQRLSIHKANKVCLGSYMSSNIFVESSPLTVETFYKGEKLYPIFLLINGNYL